MAEVLKNNVNPVLPVVLISPLDWGMGHTTRCIPIIKALTNLSCSVLIACNSSQKEILLQEFPEISFIPLKGYNISYRKGKLGTILKIIWQIPKILTSIKEERYFLEEFMADNEVDILISDNRYGLFHPKAYSVIMTHQLGLKSGIGKWADRQAQRQLYRFISLFDLCIVPDQQSPNSLAGELSNPAVLPTTPVRYIGPLTRFLKSDLNKQSTHGNNGTSSKGLIKKILIILSGPEPQRSILEKKLLKQVKQLPYEFQIVRGVNSISPGRAEISECIDNEIIQTGNSELSHRKIHQTMNPNLRLLDFGNSLQLEKFIDESDLVICRSGYSSVMDLLVKRKKTIMIPTPGQGEQEYLAKKLSSEGYIVAGNQENLKLKELIEQAQQYSFKDFPFKSNSDFLPLGSRLLEETLKDIIEAAAAKKSALNFAAQTS